MPDESQDLRLHLIVSDKGAKVRATLYDPLAAGDQHTQEWPEQACGLLAQIRQVGTQANKLGEGGVERTTLQALGEKLYELLFANDYNRRLRDALASLTGTERRLRLSLDLAEFTDPRIASLPWELLRAPATPGDPVDSLAWDARLVLARRRSTWSTQPFSLGGPLRIQLVASDVDPQGLGPVDHEPVLQALRELAAAHPGQVEILEPVFQPTRQSLDRLMKAQRPHILHLIAHGWLEAGEAQIALFGPAGKGDVDWVSAEDFCSIFQRNRPQVVFLQSCESGAQSSFDALNGMASQVVHHGVPVVASMQYRITNGAAGVFAQRFYQGLGAFEPVDVAVQEGRRLLQQQYPNGLDFAIPVLHMRPEDGRLFREAETPSKGETFTDSQQIQHCQAELAHPVAVACEALAAAPDPKEQFIALDHLLGNLVRYLGAIAFSHYYGAVEKKSELVDWLERVIDGNLSHWAGMLRTAARHAETQAASPLWTVLFEPYLAPLATDSALLTAIAEVSRQLDRPVGASIAEFLEALLALKDDTWRYNPDAVRPALREALLPVLRPALVALVTRFDSLLGWPLYLLNRVNQVEEGVYCDGLLCRGVSGRFARLKTPLHLPKQQRPYKSGRLYLGLPGPGDSTASLLQLDPLLIQQQDGLYFLSNNQKEDEIRFEHVRRGENAFKLHRMVDDAMRSRMLRTARRYEDPEIHRENLSAFLQQREVREPLNDSELEQVISCLDESAQYCLQVGLGEAVRIGRFWLGVEFLLMGMTRQARGALRDWLAQNRLSRTELRGILRGWVGVDDKGWRKNEPAESLGKKAMVDLRRVMPEDLTSELSGDEPARPCVLLTERLYNLLLDAIVLAGGEEKPGVVSADHLLLALLRSEDLPLVDLLNTPLKLAALRHDLAWKLGLVEPGDAEAGELEAAQMEAVPPLVVALVDKGLPQPPTGLHALGRDLQAAAKEDQARQELESMLVELVAKLEGQIATLELSDRAWELLCSPFWASDRGGRSPRQAWQELVAEPLVTALERGELPAGARLKADRRDRGDGTFDIVFTIEEENT